MSRRGRPRPRCQHSRGDRCGRKPGYCPQKVNVLQLEERSTMIIRPAASSGRSTDPAVPRPLRSVSLGRGGPPFPRAWYQPHDAPAGSPRRCTGWLDLLGERGRRARHAGTRRDCVQPEWTRPELAGRSLDPTRPGCSAMYYTAVRCLYADHHSAGARRALQGCTR